MFPIEREHARWLVFVEGRLLMRLRIGSPLLVLNSWLVVLATLACLSLSARSVRASCGDYLHTASRNRTNLLLPEAPDLVRGMAQHRFDPLDAPVRRTACDGPACHQQPTPPGAPVRIVRTSNEVWATPLHRETTHYIPARFGWRPEDSARPIYFSTHVFRPPRWPA